MARTRLDEASLRALPEQLTRYFEDHFAFRQRLVQWQAGRAGWAIWVCHRRRR